MPITLDQLVTTLTKRPLPALAITVKRVKQLLDDPNTSNHKLQDVIGVDPGFTMDLYRRFGLISGNKRGPVSNIAHAISMLGPAPVREAIKYLPVLDENLPETAKSGIYHCYSRAVHASIYAQNIGEQHGDKNPEEMGHAALLYNCAEMALWTYAGKAMQKIHYKVRKGADYGSASRSVLGFTLDRLSEELSKVWNLSPLIIQTMERDWHNHPRPMGVALANSLARASALGWYSVEVNELMEFLADFKHQSRERTIAQIHSQAAVIARQLLGVPLPVYAYTILQQSPDKAISAPETEQETEQETAKKRPQKSDIKTTTEQPVIQPEKRPKTVSTEQPTTKPIPQPIKQPSEKLTTSPNQQPIIPPKPSIKPRDTAVKQVRVRVPTKWRYLLSTFMRNLRTDLNLKHIMFVMLSEDRKQAGVGQVLGADTHSRLHSFSLNMERESLFTILLSKQQGVWLRPENSAKILPLVPKDVLGSIDESGFFCMSIFVRNKPVGFIYADGKNAMNEGCYTQFKQLCVSLSLDLGTTR